MYLSLNSKLNNYVIFISSNDITISLGARGSKEYNATFTVPIGYKALDIVYFRSNGNILCSNKYNFTQTGVSLWLANVTDYQVSATGNVVILCVKI